jgi:hypothetical protein
VRLAGNLARAASAERASAPGECGYQPKGIAMHGQQKPDGGMRENLLAIVLSAMIVGGFVVFMIIATGGLLLQILGAVVVLAVLGWIHFQLWGRTLSEETAGEREEAELRAKIEQKDWDRGDE